MDMRGWWWLQFVVTCSSLLSSLASELMIVEKYIFKQLHNLTRNMVSLWCKSKSEATTKLDGEGVGLTDSMHRGSQFR
jgi:hypothetical protein